jgi:hypothetical protein
LALGITARITLETSRLQHPDRRAITHALPALKEEAQLALRERIHTPFLQQQRLIKRTLGASSLIPAIVDLATGAIHGEEESRSGDLGS